MIALAYLLVINNYGEIITWAHDTESDARAELTAIAQLVASNEDEPIEWGTPDGDTISYCEIGDDWSAEIRTINIYSKAST